MLQVAFCILHFILQDCAIHTGSQATHSQVRTWSAIKSAFKSDNFCTGVTVHTATAHEAGSRASLENVSYSIRGAGSRHGLLEHLQ